MAVYWEGMIFPSWTLRTVPRDEKMRKSCEDCESRRDCFECSKGFRIISQQGVLELGSVEAMRKAHSEKLQSHFLHKSKLRWPSIWSKGTKLQFAFHCTLSLPSCSKGLATFSKTFRPWIDSVSSLPSSYLWIGCLRAETRCGVFHWLFPAFTLKRMASWIYMSMYFCCIKCLWNNAEARQVFERRID